MTFKSAQMFEEIIMYLSVLRYIFKSRSKKGYYDLNKQAEPFFEKLINSVYSWNLVNLNTIQSNYPAIDLGDVKNKICVQVTAENNSTKIKKTISKFIEKDLHNNYERLVFFILTEKKSYSAKFETNNKFVFNKKNDIWDLDDILEEIEKLEFNKLTKVHSYLNEELSSIINLFVDSNSLLSRIEKTNGIPPLNSKAFLKHFEFEQIDIEQGNSDILEFYKIISKLNKKSRELLYLLISMASNNQAHGHDTIYALVTEVKNTLKITDRELIRQVSVLEDKNLAYLDGDEQPPIVSVYHNIINDYNVFLLLEDFLNHEQLKQLIVDCRFDYLDL